MKTAQLSMLVGLFLLFSCSKNEESVSPSIQDSNAKVASISLKISQPAGIFWMGESDPLTLSVELRDAKGLIINNYQGNAYGKQVETTFEVRQNRTFEVVRIPVVFHFCQPSPYSHPATKNTDAQFIEMATPRNKGKSAMRIASSITGNEVVVKD